LWVPVSILLKRRDEMARNAEKTVTISREFHYDLDARSRRTLPVGWQGQVPAEVAKKIKDADSGVVVGDMAKAKRQAAKKGGDTAAAETPPAA